MFVVLQCVDIASICVVAVCCDSAIVRLWRAGFRCHGCESLYRYLPCQFPLVCRLLDRYFGAFGTVGLPRGTRIGSLLSHICDSRFLMRRFWRLSTRKINGYFFSIGGRDERLVVWPVSGRGIRVALGIVSVCRCVMRCPNAQLIECWIVQCSTYTPRACIGYHRKVTRVFWRAVVLLVCT
jgi:hypothetical protein